MCVLLNKEEVLERRERRLVLPTWSGRDCSMATWVWSFVTTLSLVWYRHLTWKPLPWFVTSFRCGWTTIVLKYSIPPSSCERNFKFQLFTRSWRNKKAFFLRRVTTRASAININFGRYERHHSRQKIGYRNGFARHWKKTGKKRWERFKVRNFNLKKVRWNRSTKIRSRRIGRIDIYPKWND